MSSDNEQVKTEETATGESKFGFKKRPRKKAINVRTKIKDESDTEEAAALDEEVLETLQTAKEKQRLREKPKGISVAELAIGKKITIEEAITAKDIYNIKTGGMVNMQAIKSGKFKQNNDDAYDTGIGTQFSSETNKRDEDEEMMKYIEEQLQAKKGAANGEEAEVDVRKFMTPEEAALFSIPEHLRQGSTHRSEEMLSNQMLSGIPEVDLGIEAKIKNIEATEEAKQKLITEQRNRKDTPSFVPNNMAVNFVQHNRFNVDDHRKRKPAEHRQQSSNGGGGENQKKKATDDFHYDRFRKQFRKH